MAISITDTEMTSDLTTHIAKPWPFNGDPAWSITWLPGRVLTRNQVITAMMIAETVAAHADHIDQHGDWELFVDGWAAELGITGPIAIAEAIKPFLTFVASREGFNRSGDKCPAWCTEDHDEPLIPGKAELLGYMDTHKSDTVGVSIRPMCNAEVRVVQPTGGVPLVQLSAGYGAEYIELPVKQARSLTAILPMCLPYSGELPVVDAILSALDLITATAQAAE